jgi:hypothetical protein
MDEDKKMTIEPKSETKELLSPRLAKIEAAINARANELRKDYAKTGRTLSDEEFTSCTLLMKMGAAVMLEVIEEDVNERLMGILGKALSIAAKTEKPSNPTDKTLLN